MQMDTPYSLTKDGFELQLASNYLGHWLLLNLILPKVLAGRNKRVVDVSSIGHGGGGMRWDDPHYEKEEYQRKPA
jgi:NAD(P)-dependent dehydrogenase (short-subunit alcohol dehydrogenase family)